MKDKVFVDTNLWVYLYSDSDKSAIVNQLIKNHFDNIIISTQVLSELFNVLTKKTLKTKKEASEILSEIACSFEVATIEPGTVLEASKIACDHMFSIYDSLILSSALKCG